MTEGRLEAYLALGRYVGRALSDVALEAYDQAMRGIPDEEVQQACIRWMRSYGPSTPLPSPKELRTHAHEPERESPAKRDRTTIVQRLQRTAKTDYQRAVARLMRDTQGAAEATKASLYRAFAEQWAEPSWIDLAEMAEARAEGW